VRNAVTISRTPPRMHAATPELGEHTVEVLAELGLSDEEIEDLRRHGVV